MTYVLGKLGARSLSHLNGWFSSPLPHSLSINLWCQVQILPLNQLEDVRTRVSQQLVCTSAQVCVTELYRQGAVKTDLLSVDAAGLVTRLSIHSTYY